MCLIGEETMLNGSEKLALTLLVAVCAGVVACGRLVPAVEPGANRSPAFEPGVPNFVLDAVPYLDRGEVGVDLALGAPLATFVFARQDSAYVAHLEIIARLMDRRGRRVLQEESWTDTLRAASFEQTQVFDTWTWNRRMSTPPGRYVVELIVENVDSGGRSARRQRVDVVSPASPDPALFGIRMEVNRGNGFVPFAGMHLPAEYDSLRAGIELINAADGQEVRMYLLRHPSDTTAAYAPHMFSPVGWTLGRVGIDYGEAEVIQHTVRRLDDPVRHLSLLFLLPPLERGAYEMIVEVRDTEDVLLSERREFVVMPPAFPRIATLDEMIEALSYIARRREIADLREPGDPAVRRARFDAFWGSLIPNRREATAVMQSYYSRIEEANLLFSTYKEGWKTDRGMVYVVMGPPLHRETEPRREIWHYSYGSMILPDYIFERYIAARLHPAFENFILERTPEMEHRWERAIDRWRDGEGV